MEGDWLGAGLALEGVTFDGVLRVGGRFMAGMAKHRSAEADSLVVRVGEEELTAMLAERSAVYYVTDYYRGHGVVLVRLGMVSEGELRDLLRVSWRITRMVGGGGLGFGDTLKHVPGGV